LQLHIDLEPELIEVPAPNFVPIGGRFRYEALNGLAIALYGGPEANEHLRTLR